MSEAALQVPPPATYQAQIEVRPGIARVQRQRRLEAADRVVVSSLLEFEDPEVRVKDVGLRVFLDEAPVHVDRFGAKVQPEIDQPEKVQRQLIVGPEGRRLLQIQPG